VILKKFKSGREKLKKDFVGKFPNNSDTYHCSVVKIWALKHVLVGKPEENETTWDT